MDRKRARRLVQEQMFELPPKAARAAPRVMMHWDDAGHNGASPMGNFFCKTCGHREGWLEVTEAEMRRGVPCPKCCPFNSGEQHAIR